MAAFRTIISRTGFTDQMVAHFSFTIGSSVTPIIGIGGKWLGLIAEDAEHAITEANEKFDNDALMSDWVFISDSTEAWEITDTDGETVIGWSMTADGWPEDNEELRFAFASS